MGGKELERLVLSLEPDYLQRRGSKRKGRMVSAPYYTTKRCSIVSVPQRVLRFKSQQRDPLKRARIQLPSVVYLLSCHKTRHCPSRRYHLRYSHDTISLLRSNYISLRFSLFLFPPLFFLSFSLSPFSLVALCHSRALTCYMTVFIFVM